MQSLTRWRFCFCVGVLFMFIQGVAIGSLRAQPQGKPGVFFSQGQAIFDPQKLSQSQKEALQNFLAQAITQAAATFLSPAQMGKHFPVIQEKILKQAERYVLTYQIYSEDPAPSGLYRVTGQVSVAMEMLKKDLMNLGLGRTDAESPQTASSPLEPEVSVSSRVPDELEKAGGTIREQPVSTTGILWAVAEKWDQEWHMPGERRDPEGLFAASVFQESQDHGWAVRLPQTGTLVPGSDGEVSSSQAMAQAKALGLHYAVVGRLALVQDQGEEAHLEATLRLLSISSSQPQGEIHKEWPIGESSSEEAVIELADFVVPQLDRQIREAPQPAGSTVSSAAPDEAGELVLQIRSRDAYADWLTLEKVLREHFKNMEVKGFEIKSEESIVRLLGVDVTSLKNLNGMQLPNGAQLKMLSGGAEAHVFTVTLTRPQVSPAGPGQ
jgi:hypothetical protein